MCDPYTPTLAQSWAEQGDDNFFACWGDGGNTPATSLVHEDPPPRPPNEDSHAGDRLASIIMNNMLDAENAAQDPTNTLAPSSKSFGDGDPMFVSFNTISPSRTITMTVAPQVCLFVLRTHHEHVQAMRFF
jgi:hypothetical protein